MSQHPPSEHPLGDEWVMIDNGTTAVETGDAKQEPPAVEAKLPVAEKRSVVKGEKDTTWFMLAGRKKRPTHRILSPTFYD